MHSFMLMRIASRHSEGIRQRTPHDIVSILGTLVFLLALAAAIAFAWARGRKSALLAVVQARPVLDADAIRAELAARYTLDPQTTRDVLHALGRALELDPGRLRLSDQLDALWDMHPQAGFHQRATFETWLVRRNPRLPADIDVTTVAQLIAALQRLPLAR